MDMQLYAGEILIGHAGQYRCFQYSEIGLTESQGMSFLQDTAPGGLELTDLPGKLAENQTWRCEKCNGRLLVVSSYSAGQKNRSVSTTYQHVRYFEATVENLKDRFQESIFSPFASEAEFDAVTENPSLLAPGWLGILKMTKPFPLKPNQDLMARLACCCLYRGIVNDRSGLIILVPKPYQYDYLKYCQTVMTKIADCIPYGLRRYLRFAGNPDDTGREKFNVFFAPAGANTEQGSCTVDLSGEPEQYEEALKHNLEPALTELIYEAAKSQDILDKLYEQLEQGKKAEELSPKDYAEYRRRTALETRPLDWKLLREYQELLETDTKLGSKERRRIITSIKKRLPGTLDRILADDPELREASDLDRLTKVLSCYQAIAQRFDVRLGQQQSDALLRRCCPTPLTAGEIEQYIQKLEASPPINNCLDENAIQRYKEETLRNADERDRSFEEKFLKNISRYFIWEDWQSLSDIVEADFPKLGQKAREKSWDILTDEALAFFDKHVSEPNLVDRVYQVVCGLPGANPRKWELESWRQDWVGRQEKRNAQLDATIDFESYFKVEEPDEMFDRKLWETFRQQSYRNAGMAEFLRAVEFAKRRSWPELRNEIVPLLKRFVEQYDMGIWLESAKDLTELYSELLAYRFLMEGAEVKLWFNGCGGYPKRISVEHMLQAVRLLRQPLREGRVLPLPVKYALECLQEAGIAEDTTDGKERGVLHLLKKLRLAWSPEK